MTDIQDGLDALGDISAFYQTHDVGHAVSEYPKQPQCIWGAAIQTGHAKPNGSYGMSMQPEMREALEATASNAFGGKVSMGRFNDNHIYDSGYPKESTKRMNSWLWRASAYLKRKKRKK